MAHIHGGNVYKYAEVSDFSANINFRGMPESVRTAAVRAIDRSVHYPEPDSRRLCEILARREGVSAGNIICGNGAAEVMFLLAAALNPKKAVLAQPCFFEYEQSLASVGCQISQIMLEEKDGFRIGEKFTSQIPKGTDLLILGNPNNPTGCLIEKHVMEEILMYCRQNGILPVIDESFFDFLSGEDQNRTLECTELIGTMDIFVLKSFTKMYAMPGLRFGYGICGNQRLLERMRLLTQPWNVSLPAQMAAEAACEEMEFARETAEQIALNRDWMLRRMREAGFSVFDSCTNYLLFQGSKTLREDCIKEGFLIRDCSNFRALEDASSPEGRYYRICIRSQEENARLLEVLLKHSREFLSQRKPSPVCDKEICSDEQYLSERREPEAGDEESSTGRFYIRRASMEDLSAITEVEALCFPAAEAADAESFRRRLDTYPEYFWMLEDGDRLVGFVNGMVTDCPHLTDEMYDNAAMHNPEGRWQMIFGVDTVPEYRRRGCAEVLLKRVIADAAAQGRKGVVLTCKDRLVHYYAKFGFVDEGISESVHGNVIWHEMRLTF